MGSITVNGSKLTITPKPGRTLLAALTEARVFIPSACGGQGQCGLCKVKITSATKNEPLTEPEKKLLSEEDIAKGQRLSCQIKTEQDLSIEIPEEYFSIKRFTGKLISKTQLTPDILGIKIEFLPGQAIDFKAGQYVQLRCPAHESSPPVIRAYSIASGPSDKNQIELIIRKVNNGICTTWVFDLLKEGEIVQVSGPYGTFCLTCSKTPIIMIAGGSGMAPMLSILNEMMDKKINRKTVFFFGAQKNEDLFKLNEIEGFAKNLPDFSFIPVLSNEPVTSNWKGMRGLVTEAVNEKMKSLKECEAYICGSQGMINACIKVLKEKELSENRIFYDKF